MADSMEAFWGQLGATAELEDPLADCDCALGANASTAVDATLVLNKMLARYMALTAQGEILRQAMAANVEIPCSAWAAYASARQDYLTRSQKLFDQLATANITVEQVIYADGKPKLDPNDASQTATLQIKAPLRPPAFVGIDQKCVGVPVMSSANLQGAMGWEPIPVQLAAVPSTALAALDTASSANTLLLLSGGVLLGLAGPVSSKTLKLVAVTWEDYEAELPSALTTYTSCFQDAVKAGAATGEITKRCAPAQSKAPPKRNFRLWGWLSLGAGITILLIVALRKRVPVVAPPAAAAPTPSPSGANLGRARHQRGSSNKPILLGDLYWHPRGGY